MPIEHKCYRPPVETVFHWTEGDTLATVREYLSRARLGDYYYDRLSLSVDGGELVVTFSDSAWEAPVVYRVPPGSVLIYSGRVDVEVSTAAVVAQRMVPAEEVPGAVVPG